MMLENKSLDRFETISDEKLLEIVGGLVPADYVSPSKGVSAWWDTFFENVWNGFSQWYNDPD